MAAADYSVADLAVAEGESGYKIASFVVTRTGDLQRASYVFFEILSGDGSGTDSAQEQYDYAALPGVGLEGIVQFAAGEATALVSFRIVGDNVFEDDETLRLILRDAQIAGPSDTISDRLAVATILADETAGQIVIGNPVMTEGNDQNSKQLVYAISRVNGTGNIDFTVSTTTLGTALAGTDFEATTSNFRYVDNVLYLQDRFTLRYELADGFSVAVKSDLLIEPDETIVLTSSAVSFTGGLGTILNDDAMTLSVSDMVVLEGADGTTLVKVVVTRSRLDWAPTATYTIANGPGASATDADDFAFTLRHPQTGLVTFAAGALTATIVVPIRGDAADEFNETFTFTLTNPVAATIAGSGVATVTIFNDDPQGSVQIAINDSRLVREDSPMLIDVRANDLAAGGAITHIAGEATDVGQLVTLRCHRDAARRRPDPLRSEREVRRSGCLRRLELQRGVRRRQFHLRDRREPGRPGRYQRTRRLQPEPRRRR